MTINNITKNMTMGSAVILTSALMATSAHAVEGGFAQSTNGTALVDGSGKCVTSSLGNTLRDCIPTAAPIIEPPPVIKAKPPVKAPVAVYVAPKPVVKRAPPKPIVKILTLNETGGSNFGFDSDKLSDKAMMELNNFTGNIKASRVSPDRITIVGHTDSIGSEKYNKDLSVRRANSVADYLSSNGMNRNMMSVSGRGESQPVANNSSKDGRAQNRRVDITVTGQEKVIIRK
jgi:OOP family OmpA-OmpF porin